MEKVIKHIFTRQEIEEFLEKCAKFCQTSPICKSIGGFGLAQKTFFYVPHIHNKLPGAFTERFFNFQTSYARKIDFLGPIEM